MLLKSSIYIIYFRIVFYIDIIYILSLVKYVLIYVIKEKIFYIS